MDAFIFDICWHIENRLVLSKIIFLRNLKIVVYLTIMIQIQNELKYITLTLEMSRKK
jgi:hypothetical protein